MTGPTTVRHDHPESGMRSGLLCIMTDTPYEDHLVGARIRPSQGLLLRI